MGVSAEILFFGALETLYMTGLATLLSYVLGVPLGFLLIKTAPDGLRPNKYIYYVLDFIINIIRSIPFLILMILVIPLSRLILQTGIGPNATIFVLVVAATPFIARLVEASLREVDKGIIEAAQSMGATDNQIVSRIMFPEAMPSLVNGATIATGTILGYSALAGVLGGGGLGTIALNYGWYRYQYDVTVITVVLLIIIFQAIQFAGMTISKKIDKRR